MAKIKRTEKWKEGFEHPITIECGLGVPVVLPPFGQEECEPWMGDYGIADDVAYEKWCDDNDCSWSLSWDSCGKLWVYTEDGFERRSASYVKRHNLTDRVVKCRACEKPAVAICHYEMGDCKGLVAGRILGCFDTVCAEHYDNPPDSHYC